jgi:hypothetical protein
MDLTSAVDVIGADGRGRLPTTIELRAAVWIQTDSGGQTSRTGLYSKGRAELEAPRSDRRAIL